MASKILCAAGVVALALAAPAAYGDDPSNTGTQQEQEQQMGAEQMSPEDCVAAGGETVAGMPATQHQEQVLDEEQAAEQAAGTEPAAGCPETGEMPSTQHQEEVIDDDAATGQDGQSQ